MTLLSTLCSRENAISTKHDTRQLASTKYPVYGKAQVFKNKKEIRVGRSNKTQGDGKVTRAFNSKHYHRQNYIGNIGGYRMTGRKRP